MENLSTITCGTFLEELASKAPTPGGGAASALCGAVAAALTAMLANLTVGKAGSEENEQQTAQIIAAAGKLREELTALADDDAAVFGKFMAAYKMPKTTDEEKAARTGKSGAYGCNTAGCGCGGRCSHADCRKKHGGTALGPQNYCNRQPQCH